MLKNIVVIAAVVCALGALSGSARAQSDMRAWNEHGQTWIVWKDTAPTPYTYEIYQSDAPITDVAGAQMVGRVFPEDCFAPRLKLAEPAATWRIPDGAGDYINLAGDEGVFVVTPHAAGTAYFAVVKQGETALGAGNTVGPITQTMGTITAHEQFSGVTEAGRHYTIYALWVDGREDPDDGLPGYPVMANAYASGIGHVFALYEPDDGRTGDPLPMVVGLHGGGDSNYFRFAGGFSDIWQIEMGLPRAFLLALDDCLYCREPTLFDEVTFGEHTRWIGYWTGFNRFQVPTQLPPNDAVVVDYTVRRVRWILDWIMAKEPEIDPKAVSLFGVSGGGAAVHSLIRLWPDSFSAGHAFVGPLQGTPAPFANFMQGLISQNLETTFPGSPGLKDWYWPTYGIEGEQLPFLRVVAGKQDVGDPWDVRVDAYEEMEDAHLGWALYWDERDHILNWPGSHWIGSERHNLDALTRFRTDQSFPGFDHDDQDPDESGRQPDPGETRDTGEPWGTWGGYYDWETDTIVDQSDRWEATIFLTSDSSFEPDNAPFAESSADLTVRRPQLFLPEPGAALDWTLTPQGSDHDTEHGTITVAADGRVTIEGLIITQEPSRVAIYPSTGDDDDDTADDDTVDDDIDDDDTTDDDTTGDDDGDDDSGDEPSDDDDDDDDGGCCG